MLGAGAALIGIPYAASVLVAATSGRDANKNL